MTFRIRHYCDFCKREILESLAVDQIIIGRTLIVENHGQLSNTHRFLICNECWDQIEQAIAKCCALEANE